MIQTEVTEIINSLPHTYTHTQNKRNIAWRRELKIYIRYTLKQRHFKIFLFSKHIEHDMDSKKLIKVYHKKSRIEK